MGTQPPASLAELSRRYNELTKSIHEEWQAKLREAVILKHPTPTAFAEEAREAIRQELYGSDAPANIPLVFGWGFLSLLPDRASQAEYQTVLKEVEQWIIKGPGAPPRAMVVLDGELYQPHVFERGNPNRLGPAVDRHFLSALAKPVPFSRGSGRLDLAQAIVDPANPLTARVAVNRLWQNHFGQGLVRTPSDFGLRSDPPTHPELLDWLATEFGSVANRYSWKRMHRSIMTSQTYQQSSDEPSNPAFDVENRTWSRTNRRRLDFEATRDSILFVTGRMEDRIGGPSQDLLNGFQTRRTIYSFLNRLDLPGLLSVFDFPSPAATSAQRDTTTISPQALFLMNGPFIAAAADAVGQRPEIALIPSLPDRVHGVYRALFQRPPKADEASLAAEFLGSSPTQEMWTQWIHALLITNEFVFVD